MNKALFIIMFGWYVVGFSQQDATAVEQTIATFFKGFHAQDSLLMKSVLHKTATLTSISITDEHAAPKVSTTPTTVFLKSIVSVPNEMDFKEVIHDIKVTSDGMMAHAWTPYTFYVNDAVSHCGTNSFTLLKSNGEWLILSITDTRKKEKCRS